MNLSRPSVDERADSENTQPLPPFRIRSLDSGTGFAEDEEMLDGLDYLTFDAAYRDAQILANQTRARMQIVNKYSNSVEAIEPK